MTSNIDPGWAHHSISEQLNVIQGLGDPSDGAQRDLFNAGMDPWKLGNRTYTPEQALAAIAGAQADPIKPAWAGGNLAYSGRIDYLHGYQVGEIDIKEQQAKPDNPGIKKVAVSTYGITIPLSTGRRLLAGNIIQSGDITPRLIGGREYTIDYAVPIIDTTKCGAVDTDEEDNKCSDDPCNTRLGPCSVVAGLYCVNFPIEQSCEDIGSPSPGDCTPSYPFAEAISIACEYNAIHPDYPACIYRQLDGALMSYEC